MQTQVKCPDLDSSKIERALAALPDKLRYTPFMDKMIMKYYQSKGTVAISRVLGLRHTQVSARYHFIKNKMSE
jgi:hypothetical protein